MECDFDEKKRQETVDLIHRYFPDCRMVEDTTSLHTVDGGEILWTPEKILPYFQTVYFAEHLLELQLDGSTRVFFVNILDDLPGLVEKEEGGQRLLIEPDYEPGSYLKNADSLVLTPLTPGIGNVRIRTCQNIIVRFFSGTTAIEFGCTFRQLDSVRDTPVIRLSFPLIGRLNKNFRSFRVKAISTVDAKAVFRKEDAVPLASGAYQIVDISAMGLAFEIESEFQPFVSGEAVQFVIQVPEIKDLGVTAQIRHISKVRDKKGYKHICGVQFDLETRSLAVEIERVAAAIQRLQLRELAEKTAEFSNVKLIR